MFYLIIFGVREWWIIEILTILFHQLYYRSPWEFKEPLVSRYGLSSLLITHTHTCIYISRMLQDKKILDSISSCSKPSELANLYEWPDGVIFFLIICLLLISIQRSIWDKLIQFSAYEFIPSIWIKKKSFSTNQVFYSF